MMKKALFIHGLNSDCDSNTGRIVKTVLSEYGYTILHPSFAMMEPKKTVIAINQLIDQEHIELVIGHSLGGFFTFACRNGVHKILINPCLDPVAVLPALTDNLTQTVLDEFQLVQKEVLPVFPEARRMVFGLFGMHDELFSHLDIFMRYYGHAAYQHFPDGHKPSLESLQTYLPKALPQTA